MFKYNIDDKVELAFNKLPDEERNRLETALSFGKNSGQARKSKVDQSNHQTEAQTGVIEKLQMSSDGVEYLVRVNLKNSPVGKLRVVKEDKLTLI